MDSHVTFKPAYMHALSGIWGKIYTTILILCVFTQFTFAQEAKVHGPDWAHKINAGDKNRQNTHLKYKRHTTQTHHAEDEIEIDELAVDDGIETDGFVADSNTTRTYEHRQVQHISQLLFFHLTEYNWAHTDYPSFLRNHSIETREIYEKKLKTHPDLTPFGFFLEDVLGWNKARCSLDYEKPCTRLPPPEYVMARFPHNRHRAREIIAIIEVQRLLLEQQRLVLQVIQSAKERLKGYCDNFGHTFFHKDTHHPKRRCPIQILNIAVRVLLAIVGITSLTYSGSVAVATFSASLAGNLKSMAGSAFGQMMDSIGLVYEAHAAKDTPGTVVAAAWETVSEGALAGSVAETTFVDAEQISIRSLNLAARDDSQFYDQVPIDRTSVLVGDVETTEASFRDSGIVWDANSTDAYSTITRANAVFTIRPRGTDPGSPEAFSLPDPWDIGSRIQRVLVREDGTPMSHDEAVSFLRRKMKDILAYGKKLEKSDFEFPHEYIPLPAPISEPGVEVVTPSIFHSWQEHLGQLQFEGFSKNSSRSETPQVQWTTTKTERPQQPGGSAKSLHKRDEQAREKLAAIYHRRRLRDALNLVQNMGVVYPAPDSKRANKPSEWSLRRVHNGYTVRINGKQFRNDIKMRGLCAIDNYTGNQTMNIEMCENILDEVAETFTLKSRAAYARSMTPNEWRRGGASPWVETLASSFTTFESLFNAATLDQELKEHEHQVFRNMLNSLVSSAYADQMCYVRCTNNRGWHEKSDGNVFVEGGVVCRTGCYEPTVHSFEALYGTADAVDNAKKAPWHVNTEDVTRESWDSYVDGSRKGFYPNAFNVDPFQSNSNNDTALLPVCFSEYLDIPEREWNHNTSPIPCTCGDKYGSDSDSFRRAAWAQRQDKFAEKMFDICLTEENMTRMAHTNPAAYLVNMCRLYYDILAPDGSITAQKVAAHFKENRLMCQHVRQFVDIYKDHRDDKFLNEGACQIWANMAIDIHKNKHVDIARMNSIVNHAGCQGYNRRCHKIKTHWRGSCLVPEGFET